MQPKVHLLVQSQVQLLGIFIQIFKCTFTCNSKCIIRCNLNFRFAPDNTCAHQTHLSLLRCTLFGITRCTNNFTLTFIFSTGQILRPFAPLSPFLRALSSVFHIPSHLHLGELLATFLCSSKEIIDCTLKRTMIYTNVCIIYSAGIALYAYVK